MFGPVLCQSPSLMIMAVTFKFGDEIVGVNSVDELVQPSVLFVCQALELDIRLCYKVQDIVVIPVLAL